MNSYNAEIRTRAHTESYGKGILLHKCQYFALYIAKLYDYKGIGHWTEGTSEEYCHVGMKIPAHRPLKLAKK